MYCCKCGKNIPDDALFCNYCGSRQQLACASCGAVLAADSAFCHKCGTPVSGTAPAAPAPAPVSLAAAGSGHVYGCSEKQNDMVYVSGKGLYYLYDCNLFFLPEGEKKPKNLTRYHNKDGWSVGLNQYNGALWFCRNFYSEKDETYHDHLIRYDLATGEKSIFIEDLPGFTYNDSYDLNRMIVRDGLLYYLRTPYDEGSSLMIVNLDNGAIIKKEMPKLCNRDTIDEWKKLCEENAGGYDPDGVVHFAGLYLHGDYGYAVHAGYSAFNIRFRLDDTSKFEFLPFNCCSTYKQDAGMISVYNDDTLVGCGCYEKNPFATTPISASGVGETTKHFNIEKDYSSDDIDAYWGISGAEHGQGWWRAGSKYFINHFVVDMEENNYQKLPFAMYALDFHEMPDGSVWIRGSHEAKADEGLYHLPAGCWEKIRRPEELERYLVCRFYE